MAAAAAAESQLPLWFTKHCTLVGSARLYGQFSLDKTLTLQAGATVQTLDGSGAGQIKRKSAT